MLEFSPNYFEFEERCGYTVRPFMKRYWAALLEMVTRIDEVCKKYDIQYYAHWGTLLGAARHKGFIPWDDDLDLCMKRPDYERFLKVCDNEFERFEEVEGIKVFPQKDRMMYHSPFTDPTDYVQQIVITNDRTIRFDDDFLTLYHGCPFVAGIDIFPLDYLPKPSAKINQSVEIMRILQNLTWNSEFWNPDGSQKDPNLFDSIKKITKLMGEKIDFSGNVRIQCVRLLDRTYSIYKEKESPYLASLFQYIKYDDGRMRFNKEWYDEVIDMPFENITLPCPAKYDEILTSLYGDWRNPVDYGGHTNKQIDVLKQHIDFGNEDPIEVIERSVERYR